MIEHDFEDIVAISVSTGKARNRTGLSADTALEEILLVARRKTTPDKKWSSIRCVTLYEPPSRLGEAAEVARAIQDGPDDGPIILGDCAVGISIMFAGTHGGPWSSVGTIHSDTDRICNGFVSGVVEGIEGDVAGTIPMTTLGELFDVGPTHDLIGHPVGGDARGAFTLHPVTSDIDAIGIHRSLWKADASNQTKLMVTPTHWGIPYRRNKTKEMWDRRSTLFVQRGMQWTSQSILAATTTHGVMGGRAWTSLYNDDHRIMKAFALYSNSIYGMMIYWAHGIRTQLGRSMLQVKAIKSLPCPDFAQFDDHALDEAAADFDVLCMVQLLPAWEADRDKARAKINDAVSKLFGVPYNDTSALAKIWCAEPSVRSKKRPPVAITDT